MFIVRLHSARRAEVEVSRSVWRSLELLRPCTFWSHG